MTGHFFACVQIFLDQRWRHHECVADVGEAFPGSAVDGKLTSGLQRNAGQILNSISELGIVQPSQNDRAGIACVGLCVSIQNGSNPISQRRVFDFGRLMFGFFGWHLTVVHHLDDSLPRHHILTHIRDRLKLLQVQFALFFGGRMAAQAILF